MWNRYLIKSKPVKLIGRDIASGFKTTNGLAVALVTHYTSVLIKVTVSAVRPLYYVTLLFNIRQYTLIVMYFVLTYSKMSHAADSYCLKPDYGSCF